MGFIDLTHLGPAEVAHGWMFIGLMVNILLLGIMVTQVYLYYVTYKNDKLWTKLFVAILFVADVVNTGVLAAWLYETLIVEFGNLDALAMADWLFACEPASTAVIAMAVQLFFAWRVFILTKTPWWAAVIVPVTIAGGVAGILTGVNVMRFPKFVEFQKFKPVVITWLASEVIADVLITSILVWYLVSISLTVQTGLITMIFASFDLFFYLIDPSGLHLLFNYPLAKLYSNSIMSSLNSRRGWQFGKTGDESQGQTTSSGNVTLKSRPIQVSAGKNNDLLSYEHKSSPAEVYVHVESHELRDIGADYKDTTDLPQSKWSAV